MRQRLSLVLGLIGGGVINLFFGMVFFFALVALVGPLGSNVEINPWTLSVMSIEYVGLGIFYFAVVPFWLLRAAVIAARKGPDAALVVAGRALMLSNATVLGANLLILGLAAL